MKNFNQKTLAWTTVFVSFIALTVVINQAYKLHLKNQEMGESIKKLNEQLSKTEDELQETKTELDSKVETINKKEKRIDQLVKDRDKKKKSLEKKTKLIKKKNSTIKKLKQDLQAKINKNDTLDESETSVKETANNTSSKKGTFNMNASHYTSKCKGCTGKTATGIDVTNTIYHKGKRVIAVDPSLIKLGSKVRVTGGSYDFEAYAIDTGGAIKGNRIDILVSNKDEAYKLGRKQVKVEVLN